jgi:hypothetical protein
LPTLGDGVGTSPNSRTSISPKAEMVAACMADLLRDAAVHAT